MNKAIPLVVLVVLAALVVFLLTRDGGSEGPVAGAGLEEGPAPDAPPPALGGSGTGPRPAPTGGTQPSGSGEEEGTAEPDAAARPRLKGIVVDAETGKGIAGARLGFEPPDARCPRVPEFAPAAYFEIEGARGAGMPVTTRRVGAPTRDAMGILRMPAFRESIVGVRSGADGSFDVEFAAQADLFVRAPGYLMACVCGVTSDAPITVRLVRGLSIEGVVVRDDGQPVEGAIVSVRPAPGTDRTLGHLEQTMSGDRGAFVLSGLVAGALTLSVAHPKHMPLTWSQPVEPGTKGLRVVLTPALLATFRVLTDDGKPPEGPTLAWKTSGAASIEGLTMLVAPNDPASQRAEDPIFGPPIATPTEGSETDDAILRPGTVVYLPVAIPCSRPDVTFTVKAIGMEAWVSPPEPLPPEGGSRTFDVALRRDPTLGSLRIVLEDRDGKALSWMEEKAQLSIGRRDQKPIPAGVLLLPSEDLTLPALPEGPYQLLVRSPGHAPVKMDADVAAGLPAEVKVVVGPPAKVHVRFTAPEATMVQFRLMQGPEIAWPFPELRAGDTTVQPDDDDGSSPSFVGGADGITLSGLAAGRYTIEVLTPTLTAPATAVDLVEGETREIEIAVSKR